MECEVECDEKELKIKPKIREKIFLSLTNLIDIKKQKTCTSLNMLVFQPT